jgi:hypothetical protein
VNVRAFVMNVTSNTGPIRLIAIPEIARRARLCSMTVRRHIESSGLKPDALLVTTGRRPPVQCFVEPRAEQIEKQLANVQKVLSKL